MARLLGLDVGSRRIGVALSDPDGMLATGHGVIDRQRTEPFGAIATIAREREVALAVVGLPLNADGSEGPAALRVREFGAELARRTGLMVAYQDERYTTVTAEETLAEGGVPWQRRKGLVDKLAAQLLLQGFLDAASRA